MNKLHIKAMELGWVATNVYIVYNEDTKECVIIDPAAKAEKIEAFIDEEGLKPVAILLTHAHADHMLALDEIRDRYKVKAYLGEHDADLIENSEYNAGKYLFRKDIKTKADVLLKDGEKLELLGHVFEVIETPGHTHGSVCYLVRDEDIIFTGDTLFRNSYGRYDLYSGDFEALKTSLRDKIFTLDDKIIVYPGHMSISTLEYEKKNNPIVKDSGQ